MSNLDEKVMEPGILGVVTCIVDVINTTGIANASHELLLSKNGAMCSFEISSFIGKESKIVKWCFNYRKSGQHRINDSYKMTHESTLPLISDVWTKRDFIMEVLSNYMDFVDSNHGA